MRRVFVYVCVCGICGCACVCSESTKVKGGRTACGCDSKEWAACACLYLGSLIRVLSGPRGKRGTGPALPTVLFRLPALSTSPTAHHRLSESCLDPTSPTAPTYRISEDEVDADFEREWNALMGDTQSRLGGLSLSPAGPAAAAAAPGAVGTSGAGAGGVAAAGGAAGAGAAAAGEHVHGHAHQRHHHLHHHQGPYGPGGGGGDGADGEGGGGGSVTLKMLVKRGGKDDRTRELQVGWVLRIQRGVLAWLVRAVNVGSVGRWATITCL